MSFGKCNRCPKQRDREDRKSCVVCRQRDAEYYQANKGRILEYKAEYRQANKGQIAERAAEYRQANKGQIAERMAEYYRANKDRIAEYRAEHYQANKERITERSAEHYQANKERITERIAEYRRTAAGAFSIMKDSATKRRKKEARKPHGNPSKYEFALTLEYYTEHLFRKPCHYCGLSSGWYASSASYGVDRYDNEKGYTVANSVPCCAPCNRDKGVRNGDVYEAKWKEWRSRGLSWMSKEMEPYLPSTCGPRRKKRRKRRARRLGCGSGRQPDLFGDDK